MATLVVYVPAYFADLPQYVYLSVTIQILGFGGIGVTKKLTMGLPLRYTQILSCHAVYIYGGHLYQGASSAVTAGTK